MIPVWDVKACVLIQPKEDISMEDNETTYQ